MLLHQYSDTQQTSCWHLGKTKSYPGKVLTEKFHWQRTCVCIWQSTASGEDENAASNDVEFDAYRLQLCRGKVSAVDSESTTSSFTDVYEGPNTSHLVTNLDHNVQYSLRVSGGCYADGNTGASWSPWSLPVTWSTSLPRRGICHCLVVLLLIMSQTDGSAVW